MIKQLAFLILILNSSLVFASNLVEYDPNDSENIQVGRRTFLCTSLNNKIAIGTAMGNNLMRPYTVTVRKAKKQVRKANDTNRAKRERKFAKVRSINKKAKKKCKQARNGGGDSGSGYNFDSNGNVTATGKTLFQIPSSLSANVDRGSDVFNEFCTGCHMEQRNLTFPYYREAIKNPAMGYYEEHVPDQELADLVAYLNRFRFSS